MHLSTDRYTHLHWNISFRKIWIFKGFHEVNRITARAGIARCTSGIMTFGEKDPEATLNLFIVGVRSVNDSGELVPARRFLGMTKMPLLPIRKLPEVSSIGQVSWCFMALGGIWKASQGALWCEYVCWDVFWDTWWKVCYLTEQYLNK